MHREQLDKRRDEWSVKEEDEIPLRDIGCKLEDLRISDPPQSLQRILHRTHTGPFPPFLLRPSVSRREGGTFRMSGEPREHTRAASGPLLSRPRYRSRGPYLHEARQKARLKSSPCCLFP